MKRLLLIIIAICAIMPATNRATAQEQGDFRFGVRAGYYFRAKALGLGVYGTYSIKDWLNVEPGVNVMCKPNSTVDVYCDFQVPLEVACYWHVFPIVGLSANDIGSRSQGVEGWSCGFNLGLGSTYELNHRWLISGQVKWMAQTAKRHPNAVILSAGIGYCF